MSKLRIVITDDHQLMLDGLETLIGSQAQWEIVGKANNGSEAWELVLAQQPDMLLSDIDMPLMNGLELTQKIKAHYPSTRVIILSMHSEKALILAAIEAGADGYLVKNTDREEFLQAISRVAAGHTFFSEEVTLALLDRRQKTNSPTAVQKKLLVDLSQREQEILKLIAEGLSNTDIGEQLFISPRTVDSHRANLMKKLQVNSLAALIRIAIQSGLVE